MTDLRELQLRFQDYLVGASEAIENDIVSTEDALAEHRLGAYYNAYRIRLIDCLAVDYQALEKHLGREAFEELALDYLARYPSTHPSVRWFGRHLPRYLSDDYRGKEQEFLFELARLRMGPDDRVRCRRLRPAGQPRGYRRGFARGLAGAALRIPARTDLAGPELERAQIESACDRASEIPAAEFAKNTRFAGCCGARS